MSLFSLVKLFHPGPGFAQIAGKSTAKENIEVLVAARVRMFRVASHLNAFEMFAVTGTIAAP